MNEVDTLLAAKIMKQFTRRQAISMSDAEELVTSLAADGDSLHLCFNKVSLDENKPIDEMTLSEYRAYVEEKISCFIMHPKQKKVNYTIHITETGLLTMKSDRKYEKHVFYTIQAAFRQPYYSPFSKNCLLYFDDLDNCESMTWSSIKGIRAGPVDEDFIKQEPIETEVSFDESPDMDNEDKTTNDSKYIFKRINPVSMLTPPFQYTKALYAYNIAPDDWLMKRKF